MNDWAPAMRLLTRFEPGAERSGGGFALPWFPAVGAGLGLAGWVLAALAVWLFGPRAGAAVAAVAILIFEGWATGGRRYTATVRLLEGFSEGAANAETSAYLRLAAFQGILVLKLACYGVLAGTHRGAWLMVVGALSAAAAVHASAVLRPSHRAGAEALWEDWGHWLAAAGVAVIAGRLAGALLPGLFAASLCWILPAPLAGLLGPDCREAGSTAWLSLAEALALVVLVVGALAALGA
ncbi:MAG: hypothetical protein GX595_10325 [Lentisphaerae bacterium]|nr:hypothetical protein [Lentisphaerota bacterium]